MDDIRITPSNLPDAAASVRKPDDVRQSVSGRPTPPDPTGVRDGGATDIKQALDTARVAGTPLLSLGRLLPMPILQSPTLMQTEWAWRRLVMDALLQSMSQAFTEDPPGPQAPTPPAPDSMPMADNTAAAQNANATQNASAAAEGAGIPSPEQAAPAAPSSASPSVNQPVQQPTLHPSGPIPSPLTNPPLTPGPESPVLLRYEPVETQNTQVGRQMPSIHEPGSGSAPQSPNSVPAGAPAGQGVMEKALGTLWNHLAHFSQSAQQTKGEGTWNLPASDSPLQAFVSLKSGDMKNLDPNQKAAVLLDRFQGATATDTSPRVGAGLFYPLVPAPVPTPDNGPKRAVQWQAERQTRITRTGQIVYRLKLRVEVSGEPVELTFLSAKPVLTVHVATQDKRLRTRIERPDDALLSLLHGLGWQLDNWSAGEISSGQAVDGGQSPVNDSQ